MNAISIIMPCHNRAYDLIRVLSAYDCQNTEARFEIIAVDDGSSDATYQILTTYHPRHFTLRSARLEKSQGSGAARNHAIPLVTSPLILFVGDDIFPEPDLVPGHLESHRRHPDDHVAILGRVAWPSDLPQNSLMTHIDGLGAEQFSYYYLRDGQEYDFRHFYTSNISLKSNLLRQLDYWFDPDFTTYGFEDVELGLRLSRRGLRIIYAKDVVARHYHYHTIWTFATRQYRAGLMAYVFFRKHPGEIRTFKAQYWKLCVCLWQAVAMFPAQSPGSLDWLEAAALRLSSFCEWMPHPLGDNLYFQVLHYFYYKGLVEGVFGKTFLSPRIHHAHARHALLPALNAFLTENAHREIQFPTGCGLGMLPKTLK